MLDRLSHTPVVVYDASWTLVLANAPYDALMGETTTWHGLERNAVWRNVAGLPSRVVHTPQEQAEHEARLVADLRLTASRYPADRALRSLVADLAAGSPRFAELWDAEAPPVPDRPVPAQDHRPPGGRPDHPRLRHAARRPATTCASASTPPSPAPRTPTVLPRRRPRHPVATALNTIVRKCRVKRHWVSVWFLPEARSCRRSQRGKARPRPAAVRTKKASGSTKSRRRPRPPGRWTTTPQNGPCRSNNHRISLKERSVRQLFVGRPQHSGRLDVRVQHPLDLDQVVVAIHGTVIGGHRLGGEERQPRHPVPRDLRQRRAGRRMIVRMRHPTRHR